MPDFLNFAEVIVEGVCKDIVLNVDQVSYVRLSMDHPDRSEIHLNNGQSLVVLGDVRDSFTSWQEVRDQLAEIKAQQVIANRPGVKGVWSTWATDGEYPAE